MMMMMTLLRYRHYAKLGALLLHKSLLTTFKSDYINVLRYVPPRDRETRPRGQKMSRESRPRLSRPKPHNNDFIDMAARGWILHMIKEEKTRNVLRS